MVEIAGLRDAARAAAARKSLLLQCYTKYWGLPLGLLFGSFLYVQRANLPFKVGVGSEPTPKPTPMPTPPPVETLTPDHFSDTDRDGQVLCCIALDEAPYIDEWADYHLGLGFTKIILFDNSPENELKRWGDKRPQTTVLHYPGINRQDEAYLECAKGSWKHGQMKWAAFWDVDEFLVLKKHDTVQQLLEEHLSSGALSLNWQVFGTSGKLIYEPLPVTKRFVYREEERNQHVKSIVRLRDMDLTEGPNPHYPKKLSSGNQHNTDGYAFEGPYHDGPTDVAVIHHYMTKSYQEYKKKRMRGRADTEDWNAENAGEEYKAMVQSARDEFRKAIIEGEREPGGVFDDAAWQTLKRVAPKYEHIDAFDQQ